MTDVRISEERFLELLEEEHWHAFNSGITLGGEWFDGALSDAEWLVRELGLERMKRYPAEQMKRGVEGIIQRKFAAAVRVPPEDMDKQDG